MRQSGNDTDHNDQGNTIADSAVGNPFAEPHDEHCSANQNQSGENVEACALDKECICRKLSVKIGQIGRTLDRENHDGQVTSPLIHLSSSALAFFLKLLEVWNHNAEELEHDRCRDVRHYTQCKYGSVSESSSGEHIEQSQKTLGCLSRQI